MIETIQKTVFYDQLENFEEFWRPEKIYCHSDFNEKPEKKPVWKTKKNWNNPITATWTEKQYLLETRSWQLLDYTWRWV